MKHLVAVTSWPCRHPHCSCHGTAMFNWIGGSRSRSMQFDYHDRDDPLMRAVGPYPSPAPSPAGGSFHQEMDDSVLLRPAGSFVPEPQRYGSPHSSFRRAPPRPRRRAAPPAHEDQSYLEQQCEQNHRLLEQQAKLVEAVVQLAGQNGGEQPRSPRRQSAPSPRSGPPDSDLGPTAQTPTSFRQTDSTQTSFEQREPTPDSPSRAMGSAVRFAESLESVAVEAVDSWGAVLPGAADAAVDIAAPLMPGRQMTTPSTNLTRAATLPRIRKKQHRRRSTVGDMRGEAPGLLELSASTEEHPDVLWRTHNMQYTQIDRRDLIGHPEPLLYERSMSSIGAVLCGITMYNEAWEELGGTLGACMRCLDPWIDEYGQDALRKVPPHQT